MMGLVVGKAVMVAALAGGLVSGLSLGTRER